jgi:hypothetical protein
MFKAEQGIIGGPKGSSFSEADEAHLVFRSSCARTYVIPHVPRLYHLLKHYLVLLRSSILKAVHRYLIMVDTL